MNGYGLWLSCVLVALAPTLRAADTGTVTGTIDKPDLVTNLFAIDRTNDKQYPGRVDAVSGRFSITGLSTDKAYDVIVEAGPARLEGVNLKVRPSDYEEEQPLSEADKKKIEKICRSLNKFEDVVEVMVITGNIQHAAVILNKMRTKPFYMSKPGEVVWRLELWKFERPEESWVKTQDELFLTYHRQRLQKSDFDKKMLTLDPALGGLRPTEKQPTIDVGKVALPGKDPGVRLRKEHLKEVTPPKE